MAVKLGESFFGWPPWAGIMRFITHFAEDQNKQQIYGNFQEFPISLSPWRVLRSLGSKPNPSLAPETHRVAVSAHRNSPRMSSLHFALGDASKYGLLDLRDPSTVGKYGWEFVDRFPRKRMNVP